jgi:hypothetical protein
VREQEVAGEDGDGVVPTRVDADRAAAHGRLVHHVVVVQRRQVHELDGGRGGDDVGQRPVGDVRGDQGEQRAEAFATRVHQMQRGLVDERDITVRDPAEDFLHVGQCHAHGPHEVRISRAQAQRQSRVRNGWRWVNCHVVVAPGSSVTSHLSVNASATTRLVRCQMRG